MFYFCKHSFYLEKTITQEEEKQQIVMIIGLRIDGTERQTKPETASATDTARQNETERYRGKLSRKDRETRRSLRR